MLNPSQNLCAQLHLNYPITLHNVKVLLKTSFCFTQLILCYRFTNKMLINMPLCKATFAQWRKKQNRVWQVTIPNSSIRGCIGSGRDDFPFRALIWLFSGYS